VKLLIVGTSQAGCLMTAYGTEPSILSGFDVGFLVVPGGCGPEIVVDGKTLRPGGEGEPFAAFKWPEDLEVDAIDEWDVIVISGMGLIDAGHRYKMLTVEQGLLFNCQPRAGTELPLLSEACYRQIIAHVLERQPGVVFARQLRQATTAHVIIQPSPLLSDEMPENEDWPLARLYHNPARANAFFTEARLAFLTDLSREIGADLLPFAGPDWLTGGFTPRHLMEPYDGVHANVPHGRLILLQIAAAIAARTAPSITAVPISDGPV
jgi:hypothetical protein